LSDSTYFEIDVSFLSQDIEDLQKYIELFLIEKRAAYRCFAPIGQLNNSSCCTWRLCHTLMGGEGVHLKSVEWISSGAHASEKDAKAMSP
jgi:hypothetical protein